MGATFSEKVLGVDAAQKHRNHDFVERDNKCEHKCSDQYNNRDPKYYMCFHLEVLLCKVINKIIIDVNESKESIGIDKKPNR